MFYKKKPVIIEAIQFWYNTDSIKRLKEFCGDSLISHGKHRHPDAIGWLEIGILEDGNPETAQVKHIASEGDWIIKGIQGEFYAIKPDIFEETYEFYAPYLDR